MKAFINSSIPYIVAVLLLLVTVKTYNLYLDEKKTTARLTDNLSATQKEAEYFKARNGDQAVKITSLELTVKELKATIPQAIEDIKNLYIAPRQLISYTAATTDTREQIITTLKDSLIITTDTVKVSLIDYFDEWISIEGIIRNDTASLDIRSRDTIKVVNYLSRRPRPWLWIFGGRRHPNCVITNKNPHNRITIEKSILMK